MHRIARGPVLVLTAALALVAVPAAAEPVAGATEVTGVVTVDGVPLPDAMDGLGSVTVMYWEPSTGERRTTESDPDTGAYALDVPGTAPYYLAANVTPDGVGRESDDLAPVFVGADGTHDYAWQTLAPATDAAATDVTLDLDRSGTVVVKAGDLHQFDDLTLRTIGGRLIDRTSSLPATFSGLVPGRYTLQAWTPWDTIQHPPAPWQTASGGVVVEPGGTTTIVPARSDTTPALRGTVTKAGAPVAGAMVRIDRVTSATHVGDVEWGYSWDKTDSRGRYAVDYGDLLPGRYQIRVESGQTTESSDVFVSLRAGVTTVRDIAAAQQGRLKVVMTATARKHQSSVTILDSKGVQRGGMTWTSTGAAIDRVPPGTHTLIVHDSVARTYEARRVVITRGKTATVNVNPRKPTVTVSGRVTGPNAARAGVTLVSNRLGELGHRMTRASSTGWYSLRDVVPGADQVLVVKAKHAEVQREMDLVSTRRLDVRLPATSGVITGRLTLGGLPYDGSPGDVWATLDGGGRTEWARVNARGQFSFPAGTITAGVDRTLAVTTTDLVSGVPYAVRLLLADRTIRTPGAAGGDLGTLELVVRR